jgi:hypothetical protein
MAMRSRALLLAMPILLATGTPSRAAPYAPKIGQRHADFTLPDIATGKPISLSDFRGKKVLLIQFASW